MLFGRSASPHAELFAAGATTPSHTDTQIHTGHECDHARALLAIVLRQGASKLRLCLNSSRRIRARAHTRSLRPSACVESEFAPAIVIESAALLTKLGLRLSLALSVYPRARARRCTRDARAHCGLHRDIECRRFKTRSDLFTRGAVAASPGPALSKSLLFRASFASERARAHHPLVVFGLKRFQGFRGSGLRPDPICMMRLFRVYVVYS